MRAITQAVGSTLKDVLFVMRNEFTTLKVRVASMVREADEIRSFELVPVQGNTLPPFSAGAHIDVHIADGLVRQYSLCNAPTESHRYVIAVQRESFGRGGSAAMHVNIKLGDELTVSEPKNRFPLELAARKSLLFAGGIGITPILSMMEQLTHNGADFQMYYCTRSRNRTAFLERIAENRFSSAVNVHIDDEHPSGLDISGAVGLPMEGCHLYVCGPVGFMNAVLAAARAQGWSDSQLHHEFFTGSPSENGEDGAFEVQLASSGRVLIVPPGKSVISILEAAAIEIPTSCEQGVCGTCLTKVLEGVPDHRDSYLTPEERASNEQFIPCCSRSKSPRLVLDL